MVDSRRLTAVVGLIVSLAVSVLFWIYFDTFVFFLFVPFVPFLFRGSGDGDRQPAVRECPQCDFQTRNDAYDYCPRDGRRLESESDRRDDWS